MSNKTGRERALRTKTKNKADGVTPDGQNLKKFKLASAQVILQIVPGFEGFVVAFEVLMLCHDWAMS
jgi:hypothetical protein